MGKKNNWSYFLFVAGIIIPALFFLLTNKPFEFRYLRNHNIIIGLNPFAYVVLNLLIVILIVMSFRLIDKLKMQASQLSIIYLVFGLAAVLFMLQGILPSSLKYIQEDHPRRYTDIVGVEYKSSFFERYADTFTHVIILGMFLFFFLRNFPVEAKNKGLHD